LLVPDLSSETNAPQGKMGKVCLIEERILKLNGFSSSNALLEANYEWQFLFE
jgi:hypothetical protein